MSAAISALRAALSKMHARACGDTSKVYMSIPADATRDADLLLSAALDELEQARARLLTAQGEWRVMRSRVQWPDHAKHIVALDRALEVNP